MLPSAGDFPFLLVGVADDDLGSCVGRLTGARAIGGVLSSAAGDLGGGDTGEVTLGASSADGLRVFDPDPGLGPLSDPRCDNETLEPGLEGVDVGFNIKGGRVES